MNFLTSSTGPSFESGVSRAGAPMDFEASSNERIQLFSDQINQSVLEICGGIPGEVLIAHIKDIEQPGTTHLYDIISFCTEKKYSPDQFKQSFNDGKIGIFHYEESESGSEEKPTIRCNSELKNTLEVETIELHRRDKAGKKTVVKLTHNDFVVKVFTADQRARISKIAFAILAPPEKEPTSESDKHSLTNRKIHRLTERQYESIKNRYPDPKTLRAEQEKAERKHQEFKQTEEAAVEKKFEEDKTKKLDQKASYKRKFHLVQDEKRELLQGDLAAEKKKTTP